MFKISRDKPWPPSIDLTTVRQTVAYMQGDLSRVPGLEKVAAALSAAMKEIDAVQPQRPVVNLTEHLKRARFLPRRN